MPQNLTAEVSVTINAPAEKVWQALTTPSLIKQYLFGTNVKSDWKVGSPITYEGEYQGTQYQDKGEILEFEPNKLLKSTYWSSMGGKEDKPENYNTVTYTLEEQAGGKTKLTLTQGNIQTEEAREHSAQNWKMVLDKLKEVAEAL